MMSSWDFSSFQFAPLPYPIGDIEAASDEEIRCSVCVQVIRDEAYWDGGVMKFYCLNCGNALLAKLREEGDEFALQECKILATAFQTSPDGKTRPTAKLIEAAELHPMDPAFRHDFTNYNDLLEILGSARDATWAQQVCYGCIRNRLNAMSQEVLDGWTGETSTTTDGCTS